MLFVCFTQTVLECSCLLRTHLHLIAFFRSYMCMIGCWHHHVARPSVCPSVSVFCNAVHCGSQGRCYTGPKSCANAFLTGKFLFVPSDTFAVGCIVQPQNAPKKRVEESANVSFFRQTVRRALVGLRSAIHV